MIASIKNMNTSKYVTLRTKNPYFFSEAKSNFLCSRSQIAHSAKECTVLSQKKSKLPIWSISVLFVICLCPHFAESSGTFNL